MSDFNESLYFRDLNRFPTLKPEEEATLIAIIKNGESDEIRERALQHLIRGNLRFVVSVARKYQGRGLSLLDLINEGNLGLFKAAKRFDSSKDVKFISYAVWWIRQSIQKALFEQVGPVRIPPNKLTMVNRFKRALVQNGGDYERTMAMPEFAGSEQDIVEVMEKIIDISIDAPINDDSASGDSVSSLLDILGTDGNQESEMEKKERKALIEETLKSLSHREEEILRMFYGLDAVEDTTLKDIGEDLKLSRERVRQIKNKTLRKLQKNKEKRDRLSDFLEG
ncbi:MULTISPECIES: RNA polymerase sigma factor RpoD/SigA [Fibrobacter]|uniref:RNA polymerase primary sigma factor n=1 Tax=Fibrobacter intestinalis TaxID=28122 RepID=A0A1T4RD76_9BACT|nr:MULTISPECIES: RNA polymerase sigma factor RpoD/SigA [Fibrobacter]PBC74683.1 RNA polymerase primary sigma factor [Fibrobacter sp. NR9]SKA13756.1 RNA polymerase primary sigma factor [Fibrobacter intestinalis]